MLLLRQFANCWLTSSGKVDLVENKNYLNTVEEFCFLRF